MSRRPNPLETGDAAHLTWGSIRWSIARQMRLAADMAGGSEQYAWLLSGSPVPLTADQVRSFVPEDKRPFDLDSYPTWILTGTDVLKPYKPPSRRRKA
jgi:hypothetical protein